LDSTAIPDLGRPAMVMLHSSHKAGKTKPQAESFKELVSRISQRCRLAPPKYADGTKMRTAFIWGCWTKYVDCSIHGSRLTTPVLDSVRKSTRNPITDVFLGADVLTNSADARPHYHASKRTIRMPWNVLIYQKDLTQTHLQKIWAQLAKAKNMASTLELAIVYVRVLQKGLTEIRARLEVAEKLMKGNSNSSQTSD
jgi:hypothetical protein